MKFRFVGKEKLEKILKAPGVYVLSDDRRMLYIGKAANLQERIKSHFQRSSYRDNLFIDKVTRVGWIETLSDIDALLLESQLIKQKKPRYNVMWRDDKGYFYVGITKETLPRVFLTHQPARGGTVPPLQRRDSPSYVGPFVDGGSVKQVLRLLRHAFPYYTQKKHGQLPCPYCHINLCPGPKPDVKGYKQNVKNLVAVLGGRRVSVLKNLKKSMGRASKDQDFEKATVLRDQVFALERIMAHRLSSPEIHEISMLSHEYSEVEKGLQTLLKTKKRIRHIEAYDISNIQGKFATGSMVTFLQGKPAKEWYRKFKIHITGKSNDFAMMQELISRRLKHPEWPYPDLMLIDGGKGQLSSALKVFLNLIRLSFPQLNRIKLQNIRVVALAKRNNELFSPKRTNPILLKNLPQEVSNLLLHIRDEAHRFAVAYHRKLRKVDAIGAP